MKPIRQQRKRLSSRRRHALAVAGYLFFVLGVVALGYSGFVVAASRVYQTVAKKELANTARPSKVPTLADGDAIGEIQIPRLGLKAIVVQGDSPASLRRAVGHLSRSPLPGEWGNVALAGHRDTFFRPLRNIRMGDEIGFKTPERDFKYRVESIEVVGPTELRVLESSTGHDLTLLTCFPFRYVGPAPKRFVVHAREIDQAVRK